jgi:RNA polymerase sigma-70 factor (ECF subfamily)
MKEGPMEAQGVANPGANPKANPAQATDPDLAALVVGGDQGAFELLMRRYNGALYRTARSIVRDDAEAEDIVQESYLLAYRKMSSFRGDASLATWLTRIVVNEATGRLRKTRRRADIIALVPGANGFDEDREDAMGDDRPAPETPDNAALRAEARRLIEARIDALPDQLRTVFMLRAVEDLSVQETSAALGIPEATVRSQYFRARGLLREALARDFDRAVDAAFSFDGERCDRIVAAVLARVSGA